MTLTSAWEDLQETTLDAVASILRKLEYLAGLRGTAEDYTHWGLARVYGDFPANKAIAQSHRSLVSQVLSTPIRDLADDAALSSPLAE